MNNYDELFCLLVVFLVWLLISKIEGRQSAITCESSKRNNYIDGLRAVLALLVIVHHQLQVGFFIKSGSLFMPEISKLNKFLGPWSVSMFFALTSFLFTSKLLDDHNLRPLNVLYYIRLFILRCIRLIPVALVSTLLGLALLVVSSTLPTRTFTNLSITSLLQLLSLGLSSIFASSAWPKVPNVDQWESIVLFGPHWTLHYEWLFYFCLPILGLFIRVKSKLLSFITISLIGITAYWLSNDVHFLDFLPGVLVAILSRNVKVCAIVRHRWFGYLCFMVLLTCVMLDRHKAFLICNTLLLLAVVSKNSIMSFLGRSWITNVGERSYSLYLLHTIPMYLSAKISTLVHEGLFKYLPVLYVVQTCLIMFISWICFTYIEKPTLSKGRLMLGRILFRQ
jgi:peptidoglycan/LPS O-acetylase OafA/YrhL